MDFGDVVDVDFGTPVGSEAGFVRPAVICTADPFLRFRPSTLYVVPLTSTQRHFPSHVEIEPDGQNLLGATSYAQGEQLRAVARERCVLTGGNVGALIGHQIIDIVTMIIGAP